MALTILPRQTLDKILNIWSVWNPLDPVSHATRVPMRIWTDLSLSRKEGMLELAINPNNVKFNQNKRQSSDVVKNGRIYYFWSKSPGERNLDILELAVTGQSGSILNRVAFKNYTDNTGEKVVINPPPGVINTKHKKWMKFYSMTREAAYPEELDGEFNFSHIEYSSPLFPGSRTIEFKGHFENPLQFDEKATNPFIIDYTFSFIVHSTSPDLDIIIEQASQLIASKE